MENLTSSPVSLRFSLPDAERLTVATEGKEFPLGSQVTIVDGNDEEVTYIYLQSSGGISANSINYLYVNCDVIALPAAGGEKLVLPVGSNIAVPSASYAWFVIKGRFKGTADVDPIGSGDYVTWTKGKTVVTVNAGLKTATTVGYAPSPIAADAVGDIYLFGNTGVDIA